MKSTQAYILNLVILGAVLVAMGLGSGFHRINMNRKYWTMLRADCVNTNALVNLERETGQSGLAGNHMTAVPRWIANINATMRLGALAVVAGMVINLAMLIKSLRTRRTAEQNAAHIF